MALFFKVWILHLDLKISPKIIFLNDEKKIYLFITNRRVIMKYELYYRKKQQLYIVFQIPMF